MYNIVQNGFFTDGLRGWIIHGSPHEIQRMKTIRRSFTEIPVSISISQMITVNENSSYALQFKINSDPRGMFRICVKEWTDNPEATTSLGHVYEFDHSDSRYQILTTGTQTNRLEISIENTGQFPLTIVSVELKPAQHIFSETYSQQTSELSHIESPSFLHTYLDLSAITGLDSSQMVEQARNIFARLICYIPEQFLQHILRWMNPNGAIQVVPIDHDSSNAAVFFHGPEQRVIMKIQYKNDLDTIDFMENILYGLGLALDVYAGNRASDHPEFQQLIRQEKERYRAATGYVFTGNYHDIFAQIFSSLYSPYEEVRQKIVRVVPHTAHYIQRIVTSPSSFHKNRPTNTFMQIEPGEHGKPEEYEKPSHVVEQEIQNHHTQMINEAYMSHENKEKLKQLTSEPAMEEMFRTTSLKLENDVPLIPESVEAETVTLLDEFFSQRSAKLKQKTKMFVRLEEVTGIGQDNQNLLQPTFNAMGKGEEEMKYEGYLQGTLDVPLPQLGKPTPLLLDIDLPEGTPAGVFLNSKNIFVNKGQILRIQGTSTKMINGRSYKLLHGKIMPDDQTTQDRFSDSVYTMEFVGEKNITDGLTSLLGDVAKEDYPLYIPDKKYSNISKLRGLFAKQMWASNPSVAIQAMTKLPLDAMAKAYPNLTQSALTSMDPAGEGILHLRDTFMKYWNDIPQNAKKYKEYGYYDPDKKQIHVFNNIQKTTLYPNAISFLMYHHIDRILRHTVSDTNIETFSQSATALAAFNLERTQFKPFDETVYVGPDRPEDFIAAVLFSMISGNAAEQARVRKEAPSTVALLESKLSIANTLFAEASVDSNNWESLERYLRIEKEDLLQLYIVSGDFVTELLEIARILESYDGNIAYLNPTQGELYNLLQERLEQTKGLPSPTILYTKIDPADADPSTQAEANTPGNIIALSNAVCYAKKSAAQALAVAGGVASVINTAGPHYYPIAKEAFASHKKQLGAIYKGTSNMLRAFALSEKDAIEAANDKLEKFYTEVNKRNSPYIKGIQVNFDELEAKDRTMALTTMKTIAKDLNNIKVTVPDSPPVSLAPAITDTLTKMNPVQLTDAANDKYHNRDMWEPFKSKLELTGILGFRKQTIFLQRIRENRAKGLLRNFTSDILYPLGVDMYENRNKEQKEEFMDLCKKFGIDAARLTEALELKDPYLMHTSLSEAERYSHMFGLLFTYVTTTEKEKNELVAKKLAFFIPPFQAFLVSIVKSIPVVAFLH